jgi:hypothetical protein
MSVDIDGKLLLDRRGYTARWTDTEFSLVLKLPFFSNKECTSTGEGFGYGNPRHPVAIDRAPFNVQNPTGGLVIFEALLTYDDCTQTVATSQVMYSAAATTRTVKVNGDKLPAVHATASSLP